MSGGCLHKGISCRWQLDFRMQKSLFTHHCREKQGLLQNESFAAGPLFVFLNLLSRKVCVISYTQTFSNTAKLTERILAACLWKSFLFIV
jgi:hypothetical protein